MDKETYTNNEIQHNYMLAKQGGTVTDWIGSYWRIVSIGSYLRDVSCVLSSGSLCRGTLCWCGCVSLIALGSLEACGGVREVIRLAERARPDPGHHTDRQLDRHPCRYHGKLNILKQRLQTS